jgi:hypothetical protein
MPALAEIIPHVPPSRWTAELVKQRMFDAFAIERRMPGQALHRTQSAWPGQAVHGFEDMVHWDAGEASARVLERWEAARGASARDVSLMEEAWTWLPWLNDLEERIYLQAWAFSAAYGRNMTAIRRKRRISKTTFYNKVKQGAQRIAGILNERGVGVR